ncbi:putative uncharacterized protein DDB_G0294196 [Drosophila grimshawi]|uniref:putative uncharacterized protein DDB_G0294196 n=1 Tax=Drosophila grimshawi TaxID=7222 RepID=UPI000C871451|nr:putative uncharacterized protein DDB_G0294196 [Drosophila grimshawi]
MTSGKFELTQDPLTNKRILLLKSPGCSSLNQIVNINTTVRQSKRNKQQQQQQKQHQQQQEQRQQQQ